MKRPCLSIALLTLALASSAPLAGEILTWTDARGVVHVTNRPPPEDVRFDHVIPYPEAVKREGKKVPAAAPGPLEFPDEKIRNARQSRERADRARAAAEDAIAIAYKSARQVNEYHRKNASGKKRKSQGQIERMDRLIAAAKQADARAKAAVKAANRAEREAVAAETAALSADSPAAVKSGNP